MAAAAAAPDAAPAKRDLRRERPFRTARRGQSLNTWLVNAARQATTININISSTPWGPGAPGRNRSSNKRIQGWVR